MQPKAFHIKRVSKISQDTEFSSLSLICHLRLTQGEGVGPALNKTLCTRLNKYIHNAGSLSLRLRHKFM